MTTLVTILGPNMAKEWNVFVATEGKFVGGMSLSEEELRAVRDAIDNHFKKKESPMFEELQPKADETDREFDIRQAANEVRKAWAESKPTQRFSMRTKEHKAFTEDVAKLAGGYAARGPGYLNSEALIIQGTPEEGRARQQAVAKATRQRLA